MPGYSRKSENASCEKVDGPKYVGSMTFTVLVKDIDINKTNKEINMQENRETFREVLDAGFKGATGYQSVEVIKLSVTLDKSTYRVRRDDAYKLLADYIVHWEKHLDSDALTTSLSKSYQNYTRYNKKNIDIGTIQIQTLGAAPYINNLNESGLCSVPDETNCDLKSTECSDIDGNFKCLCKDGYTPNTFSKTFCDDINECTDTSLCSGRGTCKNIFGGYDCDCDLGYVQNKMDPFDVTCEDFNECNSTTHTCHGGNCQNTDGGWNCTCNRTGFIRKELSTTAIFCEDIDECTNTSYYCGGGECSNFVGSWSCDCPYGYSQNWTSVNNITCADVDECIINKTEVSNSCIKGICKNIPGNWKCNCNDSVYSTLKRLENGTYRCLGDFRYIGHARLVWLSKSKVVKSKVEDFFNTTISDLFSKSKEFPFDLNNESFSMSDVFRSLSVHNVSISSEIAVNVTYILQIGEPLISHEIADLKRIIFSDDISTIKANDGRDTVLFDTLSIYNDSECSICDIEGQTGCDLNTTICDGHDNGTYSCVCKTGYNYTNDSFKCQDIDECKEPANYSYQCHNGGNCENLVGNWTCKCPFGFESKFLDMNNISCTDIDECSDNNTYRCTGPDNSTTCSNTYGGWQCECRDGYTAKNNSYDDRVCEDINECKQPFNNTYHCHNEGSCENGVGNWTCKCPIGFESELLDTFNFNCTDINECSQSDIYHCTGPDHSVKCSNTYGGWQCGCNVGYTARNNTDFDRVCEDINECDDTRSCVNGDCINRNGTFDCACHAGYTNESADEGALNINCTDINECETNKAEINNWCIRGSCVNTPGDWTCNCNDTNYSTFRDLGDHKFRCLGDFQYVGEVTLQWVPYANKTKQNIEVFFRDTISKDFAQSNATLRLPYNKSLPVSNIFKSLEVLRVKNIPARNVLNVSYIIHIGEAVTSENIAETQHIIFNNSKTHHSGGDFISIQFSDVHNDTEYNLCDIEGKTKCDLQSTDCIVGNGSYSCSCKTGYEETADPFHCKDVNECSTGLYNCTSGEHCQNTQGNWTCNCSTGYEAIFKDHFNIVCQNINECEKNETYICNDGTCVDNAGGWTCSCPLGFRAESIKRDFIYSCKDVNECLTNLHNCSNGGTCRNTHGNWTCDCPTGYEAVFMNNEQIECQNINECEKPDQFTCTGPKNSSTCYDIPGAWQCNCSEGFKPKNISSNIRTCEDINECHDESSCVKGECINTEGSFLCQCDPGYTIVSEAGHSACIDIDECTVNKNPCLEALGCENTEGDWTCLCSKGLDVRIVNESSKICGGQYQYVSSMSFTVVGNVVDVAKVQAALQKQIQEMYMQTLNDDSVWIEIIKIHGLQGAERRKRAPTRDISAEYIIHTAEKKNETELQEVEKVYKEQKCGNGTNNCQAEDIGGVSMVFNSVLVLNDSAICNTTRNHCNEKLSTCSSDEGKLECLCNKGYEKKNTNSLQCFDKDECLSADVCPKGEKCKNTVGSWDCSCQKGLKAIETETGKKECIDPCIKSNMKCFISSSCTPFDNEDGYICGCEKGRKGKYCQEIDHDFKESKQQTTLIAVGSSLGGLVLILTAVVLAVCRSRTGKIKEAEKISMRHMDTNGFKSFDDSYLTNQYMRDRDDGVGSFYSHRLSNISLPYAQENYENRNDYLRKPHRLPRPSFHGSMPNLANDDAHFNRFDNRRYSVEEPRRVSSYNRDLDSNYDMDWRAPRNSMNGRRSPSPDYRRPMSPRPDYHRREKLNRSKDSGVGNGYSSGSNEYRRPEKRREYYYGNRRSTNF
ncbi:fibrillin-1-like [Mercenaria mercenaria]|uniref:fibrillin-1-like n=1 Tax=Mercenaria mercenaria TaxID=6596 RepID=UPI00234E9424|nr:fibrillin-1-like [Mercenaria mercenaria]